SNDSPSPQAASSRVAAASAIVRDVFFMKAFLVDVQNQKGILACAPCNEPALQWVVSLVVSRIIHLM
ncbi:MAG: hypothetical protein E7K47_09975, partial [Acidovorax sp.]|nr:hypothetical protein [Acidovorax sp.]